MIHMIRVDKLIGPIASDYSTSAYRSDEPIFSLDFVNIMRSWFLVVCSASRTTIMDEHGMKEICTIGPSMFRVDHSSHYFNFKGCAASEFSLLIGCSAGTVGVFNSERTIKGVVFNFQSQLVHSASPVSALGLVNSKLIIGDEEGNLSFWMKEAGVFNNKAFVNGAGLPVTAVCANTEFICVAFASGCVKLMLWGDTGVDINYEAWGHCRWLSGATLSPNPIGDAPLTYLLATCGEDCFINVWKVSTQSLELVETKKLDNMVFTGIVTTLSDERIAVVAYDRREIFCSNLLYRRKGR